MIYYFSTNDNKFHYIYDENKNEKFSLCSLVFFKSKGLRIKTSIKLHNSNVCRECANNLTLMVNSNKVLINKNKIYTSINKKILKNVKKVNK